MKVRRLHPWNISYKEAQEIQVELSKKIVLKNSSKRIKYIGACDVSFNKDKSYAAIVICDFKTLKIKEEQFAADSINFPYIPGLLTFREGPILLKAFKKVRMMPDVILFDGQGIAHPRKMGIATHMGILLDRPTIGCAKSLLCGKFKKVTSRFGSYSEILNRNNEVIGVALRTRSHINPVYVSCGFKIDLETAMDVVLSCTDRFRLPEPLRAAHALTQRLKNDTVKR